MRSNNLRLASAGLFTAMCAIGPVLGQEDKGVDNAKKAIAQFAAKVAANDLDGLLKATHVPFLNNVDGNKPTAARDRDTQKKIMEMLLAAFKGKKVTFEVVEVITFAKVLEKEGGKMSKEDRKLFDEVLGKDGYAAKVSTKDADGKMLGRLVFFVATRGKDVKIVGLLD